MKKVVKTEEDEFNEIFNKLKYNGMFNDKTIKSRVKKLKEPANFDKGQNVVNDNVKEINYDDKFYWDITKTESYVPPVEVIEVVEVVIEKTIHDKFRKYIDMVKQGYLRNLSYPDSMEMLRWMEKKTGRNIPINYGCGSCMMDLVKMFAKME